MLQDLTTSRDAMDSRLTTLEKETPAQGSAYGNKRKVSSDGPKDMMEEQTSDDRGIPRFHKLSFPIFDGKEDPLPWLNRCEQFFKGQRTMEEEKVWLASYHLTGAAQQWYYRLERNQGVPSWPCFMDHVNLRFGPLIWSNALGELIQLRRMGTVDEYQEQFLALLCRCDDMTEKQ